MTKPNSDWLNCHSWPAEIREADSLPHPNEEPPEPGTLDFYYQGVTDSIFDLNQGGEA